MRFDEWMKTVPEEIVNDALWSVESYRLGLFAGDLGWSDVTKLLSDRRTVIVHHGKSRNSTEKD